MVVEEDEVPVTSSNEEVRQATETLSNIHYLQKIGKYEQWLRKSPLLFNQSSLASQNK